MNDRQRLKAIVGVVRSYLPPDGISREEAMSQIIGLVDPLPERPEQEPVAWEKNYDIACSLLRQAHDILATTQYQIKRPWVSLTDEEVSQIYCDWLEYVKTNKDDNLRVFVLQVESKLKERNT